MSERARQLHASPWQGVLLVTGGGSGFLAEMLSTPGASGTVLDAQIPYSTAALAGLLGREPEQAASSLTARLMAMAAYQRAQHLNENTGTLFGLGCTASLGTNRKKRGAHRAHWAIQTATHTWAIDALYEGERETEEAALCEQLWATVAHTLLGQPADFSAEGPAADSISVREANPAADVQALLEPEPRKAGYGKPPTELILPGSFNPLHEGHREMLAVAEQKCGKPGAWELTLRNADKPGLDFITLEERAAQFDDDQLWVTNAANFSDKAELFPGAVFALGADTVQRIGEVRFYNNDPQHLQAALDRFENLGTRFLVFGRQMQDRFFTLDDLDLPAALRARCDAVSEAEFRADVSSTDLRAAARGAQLD